MSTIAVKINVSLIDKARLFPGKNGKYLDLILIHNREPDQYGNDYMCVQGVSKEERESGVKGPILGNGKTLGGGGRQQAPVRKAPVKTAAQMSKEEDSDLPF